MSICPSVAQLGVCSFISDVWMLDESQYVYVISQSGILVLQFVILDIY